MSRMFKGDTSFLPEGFEKSQLMVVSAYVVYCLILFLHFSFCLHIASFVVLFQGKCLKYAGYHISYFVWGKKMFDIYQVSDSLA